MVVYQAEHFLKWYKTKLIKTISHGPNLAHCLFFKIKFYGTQPCSFIFMVAFMYGTVNSCDKGHYSHKAEKIYYIFLYRKCLVTYDVNVYLGTNKIDKLHCWLWYLVDKAWDLESYSSMFGSGPAIYNL